MIENIERVSPSRFLCPEHVGRHRDTEFATFQLSDRGSGRDWNGGQGGRREEVTSIHNSLVGFISREACGAG